MNLIETRKEISKEDFEYLETCDKTNFYNTIENLTMKTPYPSCGYGFLNPKIYKEGDMYYASWRHYDSCD